MKKRNFWAIIAMIAVSCLLAGCGERPVEKPDEEQPKGPSTEIADLSEEYGISDSSALLLVNAIPSESKGVMRGGKLYVPMTVAASLDTRFYWNENENRMFYTSATMRSIYRPDETSHTEGTQTVSDDAPMLIRMGSECYVCTDLLKKFSRINVTEAKSPNRILLIGPEVAILQSSVKAAEGTILRTGRDETFPIVKEITKGTKLYLAEELSGEIWTKVATEDGIVGYVNNLDTTTYDTVVAGSGNADSQYTSHMLDKKVCMVWHQIYVKQGAGELKEAIKNTKSLNVIAPTWFSVTDVTGGISSLASADYVKAAHNAGLKVWALCDDFAPGVPGLDVLSSTEHRDTLVKNLITEVVNAGADGINIDFEYITKESGPHFIQFLRELYIACNEHGLTLSTDNYTPNRLNEYYRLDEQAEFVDYIILMGYDEHYSKSKEAGSVASLPFVKNGVDAMLKKAPASKIILGVPFFARKWILRSGEDGNVELTNEAAGMDTLRDYVKSKGGTFKWDEKTAQNYAELRADGALVKIWLEDAESLKHKLNVMKENQLAGCSAWRLGFESKDVWTLIQSYFTE
ncbi:MAG: hypothetical protein IKX54_05255 [Lachnospiraceae bacterium]|nr:hypothetical protein [Lachnospiraceae bacterium]